MASCDGGGRQKDRDAYGPSPRMASISPPIAAMMAASLSELLSMVRRPVASVITTDGDPLPMRLEKEWPSEAPSDCVDEARRAERLEPRERPSARAVGSSCVERRSSIWMPVDDALLEPPIEAPMPPPMPPPIWPRPGGGGSTPATLGEEATCWHGGIAGGAKLTLDADLPSDDNDDDDGIGAIGANDSVDDEPPPP